MASRVIWLFHARIALGLLCALLAQACASRSAGPEPVAALDALFPSGRATVALEALIPRAALAPDQAVRVADVGRDAHSSHHLVALRYAETPHRHDQHDLLVVVLRGYGSMQMGAERREVGEGSILYVPRGTVHAFRNAAPHPAVAYVVYAPAFDGEDRVPVAQGPSTSATGPPIGTRGR